MIDDVFFCFGCLEVYFEILFFDEFGCFEIFKIYMVKMSENGFFDLDVDFVEFVGLMKNYLGVEFNGFVKVVVLFVFFCYIEVG